MKMAVFWVVVLCSLVEIYRRFRDAASIIGAMIADTSETSVNFNRTTRHNTEDSHLHP
jgi:hypothetical protein